METAYAFPRVMAVRALVLSCFLAAFLSASLAPPVAAQGLGLQLTLCSKRDNGGFRQTGTLKRLDQRDYVILTPFGELTLNKDDFEPCPQAPQPAEDKKVADGPPVCPPGQTRGPSGCVCPADRTMRNGLCAVPLPLAAVDPTNPAAGCQNAETLTIQGSSTIGLGIMPALIAGFANASGFKVAVGESADRTRAVFQLKPVDPVPPCLVITVLSTGSNTAAEGIGDDLAQIGMSSRDLDNGEIENLAKLGRLFPNYHRNQIEHIIALDAVGVVVNRNNPIAALEVCQIAKVFAGKIRDWRELGGAPGSISVHARTTTSGTFETFKDLVLTSCGEKLADNVRLHGTYPALLDAVESEAGGIGFAPAELLGPRRNAKALTLRSACGIEQAFNAFNVKSEDYPLARRLYVLTPVALKGIARQFENFILTDARVDDLVSQAGAIDQKIDAQSDDHAGSVRAAETKADPGSRDRFAAIAGSSRRLSFTYRFALDSEELDSKARQDIVRLGAYLRNMKARPTVYLIGFTDDLGSVPYNLALAQKRADSVRNELLTILPDLAGSIQTRGFGKILPVNCNSDELGRRKNRRVEVFIVL
jgi:phosphate transport system substrate-binding protein